jgi:hypothetical protein
MIKRELALFTPYFRTMLSGLGQSNSQLLAAIQTDLSGIYSSEQGDKRVIKFFIKNYFRKVHNMLKQVILVDSSPEVNKMISEEEEEWAE